MNETIQKQKLKSELKELKETCECKELYLRKHFNSLRNELDKELTSKLVNQTISDKKNQLTELWKNISDKIDEQEQKCLENEFSKKFINETINELDKIEANLLSADYCSTKNLIQIAEDKINRNLFQNRTITFINMKHHLSTSYRDLIDGKLLILNDDYIIPKINDSNRSVNILTIELIKSIELESKLKSEKYIIEDSFNFKNLKQLLLSTKQIKEIKQDTFQIFNSLERLDLSWNQISEIDENVFKNLTNLKQLDLLNNRIKYFNGKSLQYSSKLQSLNLSGNQISVIDELVYLPNLRQLYLGCNQINELDCLVHLNSLDKLILNGNQITEIKSNIFNGLNNLTILDLENNKITSIEENSFKNLNCLHKLNVNGNKISEVNEKLFQGLFSLERLDLKSNQILVLDSNNYKSMTNLKEIDLSDNKIKKKDLSKEVLKLKKKGVEVFLSLNNLNHKKKHRKYH